MIAAGAGHRTVSPMGLVTQDLSVQGPHPPALRQPVVYAPTTYHQDQNSTLR